MIRVVGLLVEHYVGFNVEGENCDFDHSEAEATRYILMIVEGYIKYELTLWQENGECGSSWRAASCGLYELKEVTHFRPFTHTPMGGAITLVGAEIKDGFLLAQDQDDDVCNDPYDDISTNVFWVSHYGDDEYYPNGNVGVKMELFRELKRYPGKRPVWLLRGKSGLGKSTLAEFVGRGSNLTVYETDSATRLPDQITADIVVIGNRSSFSVEEVKSRLFGNPRVTVVNFSDGEE
jgi:hypothetical protein